MSKRDDLNEKYKKSNVSNRIYNSIFYLMIVISIITLFLNRESVYIKILIIFQIVLPTILIIIKIVDDNWFWYDAESLRRKDSIANGFNKNIQIEKTDGYYNNRFKPSVYRYGINIFESSFFTYKIAEKMIIKSILKAIISVVVFISTIILFKNEQNILVIFQIISSFNIISDTLGLIFYYFRLKNLYEMEYRFFVTENNTDDALIYSYILEYESIKAYYKVRLDSKIFNRNNPKLSEEWDEIEKSIDITM